MENKRRIYIGGTFDLLHSGHIKLFKSAHDLGYVIVSLNTDGFAEEYKRKPVIPLKDRIAVIGSCQYVDEVIINAEGKDSKPAILASKATHILHGDDWTGDSLMTQMGFDEKWLKKYGIELFYLPYTEGVSTTELLEDVNIDK